MTEVDAWPSTYFASREQFTTEAMACGARLGSRAIKAAGPAGETLTVDTAAFTSRHDDHLIVLTSGLHGVEGFLGASIQIQALRRLAQAGVPDRTGIVMIHAVNPWGFAHLRRVDDGNVDVNRNFVDSFATEPDSHPRYAALDPLINPRQAPSVGGEIDYWWRAGKLIVRDRGLSKLSRPIAQGQYQFPQGLFFGGTQVGESCRLLQDTVLELAGNVGRVSLLDVHSGLGPSATATLIGNSNIVSAEQRLNWLRTHYQQPVHIDDTTSSAYNARGTCSQWCQRALSDRQFVYLCVEIGTVNPVRLFSALRRENQAHHWAAPGSRSRARTRQALLEVFAPKSRDWRRKSVAQGMHVFDRTFTLPGATP